MSFQVLILRNQKASSNLLLSLVFHVIFWLHFESLLICKGEHRAAFEIANNFRCKWLFYYAAHERGFGNNGCLFEFSCDPIFGGSIVKVVDFIEGVRGALKSSITIEDYLMEVPWVSYLHMKELEKRIQGSWIEHSKMFVQQNCHGKKLWSRKIVGWVW